MNLEPSLSGGRDVKRGKFLTGSQIIRCPVCGRRARVLFDYLAGEEPQVLRMRHAADGSHDIEPEQIPA